MLVSVKKYIKYMSNLFDITQVIFFIMSSNFNACLEPLFVIETLHLLVLFGRDGTRIQTLGGAKVLCSRILESWNINTRG